VAALLSSELEADPDDEDEVLLKRRGNR
jgi:hypothetical protein